jgi:hypothetical protein
MSENKVKNINKRFLVEWLLLNSAGWVIGFLLFLYIRSSNLEAIYHNRFSSTWQAMLGWALLGACIGIFQWLKLKQFRINIFMWVFVTALGICLLEPISQGIESLLNSLQFIPQERINLGGIIGNIDIGKNISIGLGSLFILLVGFITSGLQAVIIRRVIPKPLLWVKANMFGLFLSAIIISIVYFFKLIIIETIFLGGWIIFSNKLLFLEVFPHLVTFLGPVFMALGFSTFVSLSTGKLLSELFQTEFKAG